MTTAARRDQGPFILDIPDSQSSDLPSISSLFLIYFDIKAGYTIGWKRSLPGVELEGVVEYKSLPSGLHTVSEDLIYFVHGKHAGLSAFVNAPAAEESRNARMIAVGVMVPLSYGRLGRSWKHAEKLEEMARELVVDTSKTQVLEDFWEAHKPRSSSSPFQESSLLDSPSSLKFEPIRPVSGKSKSHIRNRSASDGAALIPPGHTLSAYHPAWSLPRLLDAFGPLIFPIHRAALLRKRILITCNAPVEETCNFVYDISILSNIPLAVNDLLSQAAPPQRLRPLFSIGVHDIPLLEEDLQASKVAATSASEPDEEREEEGSGWIACTTDSILAMKSKLYDVLITMPQPFSEDAAKKVWPKVEYPQGTEIKATQRDLRRYKALRHSLSRNASVPSSPISRRLSTEAQPQEEAPHTSSFSPQHDDPALNVPDMDSIIESVSWSALAYSGFMWWASAGEQSLHSQEEAEADASLISGLPLSPSTPQHARNISAASLNTEGQALQEMGIIAYFHRLTTRILTVASDFVDAADSDSEREGEQPLNEEWEDSGPPVYVTSADVERMGLDIWSATDHQFIEDVTKEYFGRRSEVEGRNVDICGIRIC